MAISPDKNIHGYFHGTSACLSALLAAARYEEILELVEGDTFWPYKRWAVLWLRSDGRGDEVRVRIGALVDNAQPRSDFVAEIVRRCCAGQDPQ